MCNFNKYRKYREIEYNFNKEDCTVGVDTFFDTQSL